MANVIINDTHLNNIADSIRNKNGTSTKYKPSEMATAISEISASEDLSTELTEQSTLLSNQGVTIDDIKLALQNKSAGSGGGSFESNIYDAELNPVEQGTITSSTGADGSSATRLRTKGFVEVKPKTPYCITTNVDRVFVIECAEDQNPIDNSGWASSPYLFVTRSDCHYIRITFANSSNSAITLDDFEYLKIEEYSAGGGGAEPILQSKSVAPTTSIQNIIPDSGYDGLSSVSVGAVTSGIDSNIKATNIKSGVSILGVTGTLEEGITPSGTLNITTNGTHNVTNYASASVNVPSEDLTSELNTYENYLTTQETTIDDIVLALQNKVAGSGSTDIEDGLVMRTLSGDYINNRITTIGTEALRSTQITGLHCEEVTSVGGEAIRQCNYLTYIYLPKCVTLQGYSVGICPLLERVELNSIENIQAYSFYSCPKLTTLIIRTTTKVCSLANTNAFLSSGIENGTGFVYVPDDLVDDYKSATNWSTYANQIKGLSELEG